MECIVCMCENASVRLDPCGHIMTCNKCTLPTLFCSGLRCPICRTVVVNLPQEEFHIDTKHSFVIQTSDVSPHLGVTLKNSRKGVIVSKLSDGDLGSKYLRRGDVIKAINGIPAVHHKTMVTLIDACSKSRTYMHIERAHGKKNISDNLRNLAAKYHESHASFHPEWFD